MIYIFNSNTIEFIENDKTLEILINLVKITKTNYINTVFLIFSFYISHYSKYRYIKIHNIPLKYVLQYLPFNAFVYNFEFNEIKKKRYCDFEKSDNLIDGIILFLYEYFYDREYKMNWGQILVTYYQDYCDFHNNLCKLINKLSPDIYCRYIYPTPDRFKNTNNSKCMKLMKYTNDEILDILLGKKTIN
jgi:hypothetical protein